MNAEHLLTHFDRLADAPDAVPRLRRFILDLAVRGKLVEQDPKDEPAEELVKRIAAEKKRLVEAGEVKKSKAEWVKVADLPFNLPDSWQWAALGNLFLYDAGIKREPKTLSPELWLLELEDVEKDTGRLLARITAAERESKSTKSEFRVDDILYGKLRPYLNKVLVADKPGYSTTEIVALRPYIPLCSKYCALALRRPDFVHYVTQLGQGTKMPRLRTEDAVVAPFPLPPLAEQHRIVAKVDELMALCDRLEAARKEREATRARLTAASLAHLNAPDPDSAVFQNHTAFALNNLTSLTARPDQIKALRQTILNLAVRGKLVEQDPGDEPAGELLRRIAAEKARLVEAGKIRKKKISKPEPPDSLTFELPDGWAAVRFSDVLTELQTGPFGSSLHQNDYEMGGTPVINPASMRDGKIVPVEKMAVGKTTLERLSTFKLRAGDIVMGRRGEMGRCAVVTEQEDGWLCGTGSLILRLPRCLYPKYLAMLIGSPYVREYLGGFAVGATMQNLNQSILLKMNVGLPPFAEQHRIVARVDELMAVCDRLEAGLAGGEETRGRLVEAVLGGTLAS